MYKYYKFANFLMNDQTYSNWVLIKNAFEESGNTNNFYYKRACEIVKTKKDPLQNVLNYGKE
jgi:hypothetical protein